MSSSPDLIFAFFFLIIGIILVFLFIIYTDKFLKDFFYYCSQCKRTKLPASSRGFGPKSPYYPPQCKKCNLKMKTEIIPREYFDELIKYTRMSLIAFGLIFVVIATFFFDFSMPAFYFNIILLFVFLGIGIAIISFALIKLKKQLNQWVKENK